MSAQPTYLFTGDRKWGDPYIVDLLLTGIYVVNKAHREKPIIVQGCAKGLDSTVMMQASSLGMTVHGYPARWDEYGRRAGPIRNAQMLEEEDVNVVFAFHDDLGVSKGTRNMVQQALRAGIPTYHIRRVKSV